MDHFQISPAPPSPQDDDLFYDEDEDADQEPSSSSSEVCSTQCGPRGCGCRLAQGSDLALWQVHHLEIVQGDGNQEGGGGGRVGCFCGDFSVREIAATWKVLARKDFFPILP